MRVGTGLYFLANMWPLYILEIVPATCMKTMVAESEMREEDKE